MKTTMVVGVASGFGIVGCWVWLVAMLTGPMMRRMVSSAVAVALVVGLALLAWRGEAHFAGGHARAAIDTGLTVQCVGEGSVTFEIDGAAHDGYCEGPGAHRVLAVGSYFTLAH